MRKRTRNGKIARLPRKLRDELNERLDNGEEGGPLLAWLNALPETLEVLREHFGGQPVNHQNLSDWRQGGFEDWRRWQETLELAGSFLTEAEGLDDEPDEASLSDRLAPLLTLAVVRALRAATQAAAGPEQHQMVIALAREFTQIRRTDHEEERVQLAQERWEAEQEATENAAFSAKEKEVEAMEKKVEWQITLQQDMLARAERLQREHIAKDEPVPEDVAAVVANKAKLEEQIQAWSNRPKWRWFERDDQGHSSLFKANQALAGEPARPAGGADPG